MLAPRPRDGGKADEGKAMSDISQSAAGRDRRSILRNEAPYLIILLLAAGGAGYFSMTRQPIIHYWDALAVVIAAVSILTGWARYPDKARRWRLVWTQLLHWGAFLVAMNLVFLPSIQANLNVDATSLVVLFLLALGAFTSGVHTDSPLLCANGALMALAVPAIAWLNQSALLITLILAVIVAGAAAIVWLRYKSAD
jgi:hypothetical protein